MNSLTAADLSAAAVAPEAPQPRENADAVRVGVIGYGYWCPNIVRNLSALDRCEVVSVCDKNAKELTRAQKTYPSVQMTTDFSEVLRLGPRSDAIFNERGRIHIRKNDPVAAKADFDAAVLINPRNVHALNNRGLVLVKQHRLDEAIASYSRALSVDPDYLLAYANRARAHEAKGEIELALADFKRAAERKALPTHDENARAQAAARQ